MRKLLMFLVVLSCVSHFSIAAPQTRPDDKATIDMQGEVQRQPAGEMKQKTPGILPCAVQETMEQERVDKGNLVFSDRHSRNCEQDHLDDYQIRKMDTGSEIR